MDGFASALVVVAINFIAALDSDHIFSVAGKATSPSVAAAVSAAGDVVEAKAAVPVPPKAAGPLAIVRVTVWPPPALLP